MKSECTKCSKNMNVDKMMRVEEGGHVYFFCTPCLYEAKERLKMKMFLTHDERKLLNDIKNYLKHETKN